MKTKVKTRIRIIILTTKDNTNRNTDDKIDENNDHKKDGYTFAGAAPDAGAAPTEPSRGQARPDA